MLNTTTRTKTTVMTRGAPKKTLKMTTTRAMSSREDAADVQVDRRTAMLGSVFLASMAIASPAKALDVGQKAPAFKLPGTNGGAMVELAKILSENDYAVVYFFNQAGSPGCTIESQRFEAAIPAFTAKKARVVGISMDSLDKQEEFCTGKGLKSFTILSDNDGSVSAAYGADLKIPLFGRFSDRQTFLIKKDGTVVAHWLERDQSMASVKTTAHVDQVLAAI